MFFRFFLLFVLKSFLQQKNHHFLKFEKIQINLIKYIEIFKPYKKIKVLKLHQLKKKKFGKKNIEMHSLHRNEQKSFS